VAEDATVMSVADRDGEEVAAAAQRVQFGET
jgi:hypothetical protein